MRVTMRSLLLAWMFLFAVPAFADPAVQQDWHGELATPGGKLMLVVRLTLDPAGAASGDVESINQAPGQRLPLTAVKATAEHLSFSIPLIGASYEAVWNAREGTWIGQFRQGMTLPLTLQRGTPPAAPVVDGLDGDWRAILTRDGRDLRLVLHVVTNERGTRVTLDSPDLGAFGLPVEQFARSGSTVHFTIPSTGVQFTGQLDAALATLGGAWSRSGQDAVDVRFRRDTQQAGLRKRSQWPLAQATYRSEDVAVPNPAAKGVVLAGTLTLPQGAGPFPAVILVSGSGAQDRDETMFGHKPFAVLADYLTRRGIAVLRYDDRGFGASTGNFDTATSADFASDANAAFAWLRRQPGIDARAIGLAGHSEGALVAPIAAAANPDLAFLVLLAGPATDTDRLILAQRRAAGLAQGLSSDAIGRAQPVVARVMRVVQDAPVGQDPGPALRAALSPQALQALGLGEAQREQVVAQFASPWMRYFLNARPQKNLRQLRLPVLALAGSLDTQVPAKENLDGMRSALAGNAGATVIELPGVNHMFQPARSGTIGEIADIEETFAPEAMAVIAQWIGQRFGVSKS